jgi:type IV secretory pathway VirJ component
MRRGRLPLGLALVLGAAAAPATPQTLHYEPIGEITVTRPTRPATGGATGVVILVSGDAGADRTVQGFADVLAGAGALVLGVDLRQYRARVAQAPGEEVYPSADFEVLSQFAQRALEVPAYQLPVLVGWQAGAALVYAALAEANPDTFRGAVSVDFCPLLALPKPPGRLRGLVTTRADGGAVRLEPSPRVQGRWVVVQPEHDASCPLDETRAFVRAVAHAKLSLARAGDLGGGLRAAFLGVAGVSPAEDHAPAAADVADLPLVEVRASGTPQDTLAVILSGDGGWASIDRDIGEQLAARGIGVVGLNSLRYFWTRRTPDGAGADLARILRHYLAAWHARRVVLLGYSRGADVLPFMANRLSPELRARVALVALLGPSTGVDFQFHLSDWVTDAGRASTLPVRPEVEKLRGMPILCIYGRDEADSLCPTLDTELATLMPQDGGHHFGGAYDTIVARILARAGVASPSEP